LFACGPAPGEKQCWCEALPHVSLVAEERCDCLCPKCLEEAIEKLRPRQSVDKRVEEAALPRLIEGEDYYVEGATIVFTAGYHLRRGYCCKSGCRHCPYSDE